MKKLIFIFNIILLLFISISCGNNINIFTKSFFSFDTVITVNLYNENNTNEIYNNINKIINDVDNYANNYENKNISIYKLNKERTIEYNKDIASILNYSLLLKDKTNGYFNPLIGRLTNKWKSSIKQNKILDSNIITEELNIMNSSNIEINDEYIKIIGDADIDLGAIAKGYALDLVYNYLRENNVNNYLISAGSSTIIFGKKVENDFVIELSNPFGASYGKINLSNTSLATSSPEYQNTVVDGIRYHHLICPIDGMPKNYYDSVSIISTNVKEADALSTALFLMDLDIAKEFAINNDIKIILGKDNKILYKSNGCDIY